MSKASIPILLIALSVLVLPTAAQRAASLNFVSELEDYRTIRSMLPAYLNGRVAERLKERAQRIENLTSPADLARRQNEIRARILASIGGLPEKTPLNARVTGIIERDGYRIEKVIFESQPRFFVTANLYVPKQGRGPFPGILVPLGHEPAPKAYPDAQHLLAGLALRGFVALAWDPIGQGERIQIYDADFDESKVVRSPTEHSVIGIQCTLTGDNLARHMIQDGLQALEYLLTRPEVDAARIGCTGNSGGGNLTTYLAALDDRIRVAAPSCWITSWSGLLNTIGLQDSEQTLFPFVAEGLDYPDFIYAAGAKPYLILAATRDFFSIQGTRESYAEARRVYERTGATNRLSMFEADDTHGYSLPRRTTAYRWLTRMLKGAEDASPETPMELATDEELRCTSSGQVTTDLNSETVLTLNLKRAAMLRAERPALSKREDLPAFQIAMQARVQETLHPMPEKKAIPIKTYGHIAGAGFLFEKLLYESEPGIQIPALLYLPESGPARKPAILYCNGRGKAADNAEQEELAKAGFVVLSIDVRGLGETMVIETQQSHDTRPYFGDFDSTMTSLLLDRPLVGMRATDIRRGIDLLLARSEVDPEKIYGYGKADGAPPLLFAAMLDERLRRIALEEMLLSYESAISRRIHRQIFEHVVNGALKHYDFPELVAALAPRPVWIVNSLDPIGKPVDAAGMKMQYAISMKAFDWRNAAVAHRIVKRKKQDGFLHFYRDWLASP